jgi:hypothetical protein
MPQRRNTRHDGETARRPDDGSSSSSTFKSWGLLSTVVKKRNL